MKKCDRQRRRYPTNHIQLEALEGLNRSHGTHSFYYENLMSEKKCFILTLKGSNSWSYGWFRQFKVFFYELWVFMILVKNCKNSIFRLSMEYFLPRVVLHLRPNGYLCMLYHKNYLFISWQFLLSVIKVAKMMANKQLKIPHYCFSKAITLTRSYNTISTLRIIS